MICRKYVQAFLFLVLGIVAGPIAPVAAAENYPNRPIQVVVGFAAGGATDLVARILSQKLSERMGKPVVVENRTGAGGSIAEAAVANSAADGYTLAFVSASHVINVSLYKKLPYDTVKDFKPISTVAAATNVLAVHPSVPATSVQEFIAYAKANPGKVTMAAGGGLGSSAHLAGVYFSNMAGIDVLFIPYKGTADSVRDLVSGEVLSTVDSVAALLPSINSGKLKVLGVADLQPNTLLPGAPTIDQAGLPGYQVNSWLGVLAPANTPDAIVRTLSAEINEVLKQPDVLERLRVMGSRPLGSTPEEFQALIDKDIEKFAGIIKAAGLVPQ